MKTLFNDLLTVIFLLCSTIGFTQQTYTVHIPGLDHYIHYNPNSGGYGSGSDYLYAGKNGDVYRSYIYWANIRSYIPAGSQVTQVKFLITWTGQGSQTAQIDYLDFAFGTDPSQTYQNFETGTVWETISATQTEYSFTQLTAKVQSAVNGGFNNVWIGIKNQNENNVDYYVFYQYNVSLEVTYQGTDIIVTQLEEAGVPFGQVGWWYQNDWDYTNVPYTLNLQVGSPCGLQSDTNYKAGSYQKYFKWTQNSNDYTTNHHNFTVLSGSNLLRATFKSADEGVTIKNNLEATGVNGGWVEVADPWLIDFPDPLFGNTERNRGMKQTGDDALFFHPRRSQFRFEYGNQHKGVFLNQSGPGSGWQGTYYKVGMLEEQTISINGQNRNFYPYKWQNDGGVTFQDEYARQTGVVFTSSNATATAVLKGIGLSNNQNTYVNNSQRKIVRTDDGFLHSVYESMNRVWYELSTNNGNTWQLIGNLGGEAKNPSIDYYQNYVVIAYQGNYNNGIIEIDGFKKSGNTYIPSGSISLGYEYFPAYYKNSNPIVAITWRPPYDDYAPIVLIWREEESIPIGPAGLYYRRASLNLNTFQISWFPGSYERYITGTNFNSKNPTISARKTLAQQFELAWEQSQTYINYCSAVPVTNDIISFSTPFENVSIDNGFAKNYNPSIISLNNNDVGLSWIAFRKTYLPDNPQGGELPVGETKVFFRSKANGVWSAFNSYGSNINTVNINRNSNNTYAFAWSEAVTSNTYVNKFVRNDNLDEINTINTTGKYLQVVNYDNLNNMRLHSFSTSTVPFSFSLSNTFYVIPHSIQYYLDGNIVQDTTTFYFRLGDIMVGGASVKFEELPDGINIPDYETLNTYFVSRPFTLTDNIDFIYSVEYGVTDSLSAARALQDGKFAHFKVELIDDHTSEVLGTFDDVTYDSENIKLYEKIAYQVNTQGIGNRICRLRLVTEDDLGLHYSLNNCYNDGKGLGKLNLVQRTIDVIDVIKTYTLEQNFPNPFNPTTVIKYQIPKSGNVTLKIYDILGAEIATLVNEEKTTGRYEINFNASKLASGVYIYRLSVNNFISSKKMILMK